MKKLAFFFLLFGFANFLLGQSYNTAAGIRLGSEFGITANQRIAKRITVEGILQKGITKNETALTLLIKKHVPVLSRRLNFYIGAGVHKGWISDEKILYNNPIGITGIGGAEITIRKLNASFDFKPAFNVTGGTQKVYSQAALSVRYVFVKRESATKKFFKEKKWKFWKKNKDKKKNKKSTKKDTGKKSWEIWKKEQ